MSNYTTENIAELAPQVLTPAKRKNHYECPICGQPKFSVNPATGKFGCWSKCDGSELYKIILQKAGKWQEREKQQPEPLINGVGLTEKHYEDFASSGIPREIVDKVVAGTDNYATIAKFLGWNGYCGDSGWIVRSLDLDGKLTDHGQYKPNSPHKWNKPDKKDSKYLSPSTPAEAMLIGVPGVSWQEIKEDKTKPIFITEGGKKAIKIMIHEWDLPNEEFKKFPCIALTGVCMWHERDKEDVFVPHLNAFVQQKRRFIIAFDADYRTKPSVEKQLRSLAKQLLGRGCLVDVAFWPHTKKTKGIDDLLVAGKEDQLQIKPYEEWEKIHDKAKNAEAKDQAKKDREDEYPTQSACASEIVELNRGKLVYLTRLEKWYRYKDGIWEKQHSDFVSRDVIQNYFRSKEIEYSFGFLNNVQNLVKIEISTDQFDQIGDKIPFLNGCLDLKTMILEEHKPSNYLTWCLPYNYDPNATCEPIIEWMRKSVKGNEDQVQLLRAFLGAVVRGRADLQRYLNLEGPGATGKSTFQSIAVALVGVKNTHTTTLQKLENNNFDQANLYGKKLCLIADSDNYGGKVDIFKAVTGEGFLDYEEKNKQSAGSFINRALVLIASNEPIQTVDKTSGLERRKILVPFTQKIASKDRKPLITIKTNLMGEDQIEGAFAEYIPGLMNWVLAMSNDEIDYFLKETDEAVKSIADSKIDALVQTNSIASWADQFLILDKENKTKIGSKIKQKDPDIALSFLHTNEWLYASYCEYVEQSGQKPISLNRFSYSLLDVLQNQLKIDFIEKTRDTSGRYIKGVRIRQENFRDEDIGWLLSGPDSQLTLLKSGTLANAELESIATHSMTAKPDYADLMTAETLANAEPAGNANLSQIELQKIKKEEINISNNSEVEFAISQHSQHDSALPSTPAVIDASIKLGSETISQHKPNKIVDQVGSTDKGSQHDSALPTVPAESNPKPFKFDGPNKEILIINKPLLSQWTPMRTSKLDQLIEMLKNVSLVIGEKKEFVFASEENEGKLRVFVDKSQSTALIINLEQPAFILRPLD